MPVQRRSHSPVLVALAALPVIALVYAAFLGRRSLAAGRTLVAGMLGATVIGTVYAGLAARRTIAPARRAPLPVTMAAVLAVVITGSGVPAAPVRAATSQAEAVVRAALGYVGAAYVWGTEGPLTFDCSGLVYRAFKDAGEAPLISGRRLTAAGYYKYFATRGLTSKKDGRRGDLVIYGGGTHIGIYLGNGKVVSAVARGVSVHGLNALQNEFTTFLTVDWTAQVPDITTTKFISKVPTPGVGQGTEDEGGVIGDDTSGTNGSAAIDSDALDADAIARGLATGSMNLRSKPSPAAEILGWVGRGSTFQILAVGRSPHGALWYHVRKASGKEGWVWNHWVQVIEGSVGG